MEFKPRQKKSSSDFNVGINETTIAQVNETVFLGVVLDQGQGQGQLYLGRVVQKARSNRCKKH
jgi:hypothetical protein